MLNFFRNELLDLFLNIHLTPERITILILFIIFSLIRIKRLGLFKTKIDKVEVFDSLFKIGLHCSGIITCLELCYKALSDLQLQQYLTAGEWFLIIFMASISIFIISRWGLYDDIEYFSKNAIEAIRFNKKSK